jgi:hypothetical protein
MESNMKKSEINEDVKKFHRWLHQSRWRFLDKIKYRIEDFIDKISELFDYPMIFIPVSILLGVVLLYLYITFSGFESIWNWEVLGFLVSYFGLVYALYLNRQVTKESEEFWRELEKGNTDVFKSNKPNKIETMMAKVGKFSDDPGFFPFCLMMGVVVPLYWICSSFGFESLLSVGVLMYLAVFFWFLIFLYSNREAWKEILNKNDKNGK